MPAGRFRELRMIAPIIGTPHVSVQGASTFADPVHDLCRYAGNEGVRRDIVCYHCSGGNHRITANCDAAEDCCIRAYRGPRFYGCWDELPVGTHRPRIQIVREACVWANENAISEGDAPVQRREVLDLAVVPYDHLSIDVDVLADVTVSANPSAFANLRTVPNRGSLSDHRVGGHLCCGVNPNARHRHETPDGTHLGLLVPRESQA